MTLSYSINTSNSQAKPWAKAVADPAEDRQRAAADWVQKAQELLFAGQYAQAWAAFQSVFTQYADQQAEAIAALYGMVAASRHLGAPIAPVGGEPVSSGAHAPVWPPANVPTAVSIQAAVAYLTIGLLHNEGKSRDALANIASFERDYPQSALVPYVLLDKALLLEHGGDESAAMQTLQRLATTFPSWPQAPLVQAKLAAHGSNAAEPAGKVLAVRAAPNPFNPSTTIRFEVPAGGPVSLVVYNVAGQVVKKLLNKVYRDVGSHAVVWDGRDAQGRAVASGVYWYRLRVSDQVVVEKMTLLR